MRLYGNLGPQKLNFDISPKCVTGTSRWYYGYLWKVCEYREEIQKRPLVMRNRCLNIHKCNVVCLNVVLYVPAKNGYMTLEMEFPGNC